jgi:glycine/D-amino acid oxidase-like deaminating enzyme
MKDYTSYSFWLETCEDDLTPRPPMQGSIDVDVAILGAGYTGLWTAYYLLEREPSLKIAILEKEIAGFGASGRNGGGLGSDFPLGPGQFAKRYGRDAAVELQRIMWDTVDEVNRVAEKEGFDINFRKGGTIKVARGPAQFPNVERMKRNFDALGLGDEYKVLDKKETDELAVVANATGSLYTKHKATIHPGKLVRGLARAVERKGATIYEQTEVTDFTTGAYPALHTDRGHARAKTIVLAGESYMSRFRKTRRNVLPVYSLITLTEPLSQSDWEEIGWPGDIYLSAVSFMVNYMSKSPDGRLVFGGRGAPYHFGSKIRDEYDKDDETHETLRRKAITWFPKMKDVRFTHAWGGPLGWSRDYMPTMSYDPKEGVAMAGGYTGTGQSPCNIAGRLLADLITHRDTTLTRLPMSRHKLRKWEPEPFRYIGVRFVQRGFEKLDEHGERTGAPADGTSLVERLTRH